MKHLLQPVIFCAAFFMAAGSNAQEAAEGLRDIKPPLEYPFALSWLPLLILLAVGVLAWLVYYFWRRAMSRPQPPAPLPPAWESAYKKLEQLRRENLPSKNQVKEYYIRLSNIVRQYIEARFNVRAPDMTTQEFLESVRRSRDLSARQQDSLKSFLQNCDMVKFAKFIPGPSVCEESFQLARQFVDETKQESLVSGR